jgi:flagellar basal-body rod protein FlgB
MQQDVERKRFYGIFARWHGNRKRVVVPDPQHRLAMMTSRLDQHFDYRLQVMNLRAARQQVLATNIANADTPNYKARDIDFREQLRRIQSGERGFSMAQTHGAHLAPAAAAAGANGVRFRPVEQGSIDGNTVDMNIEMARFTENSIKYQADVAFMQSRVSGLQRAISGQ